jgi:uncharacterized protein involved in copper resistance
MALYDFEAEATAFIGENGQTAARLEGEYDILLTNRLILQPTAEANFYGKNDPERGVGSGLANTEVGLRLRYEIVRQFAPTSALPGAAPTAKRQTSSAMKVGMSMRRVSLPVFGCGFESLT